MVNTPDKEPIYSYTHRLLTLFRSTDQMGYVYYGRYLDYFEVARTEMIRDLGVSYSKLEEEGFMLPGIYAQISYKSPIYYDEEMNITVLLFRKPRVKLETFYKIPTSLGSSPLASGPGNLCLVYKETLKPCMCPDDFLRLFDHT